MRKTWLITGTSSGLGLLLVQKLLRRGDRVVATVRQPAAHGELQQQYGDSLQIIRMDLTDANAIRDGVNQAFENAERIDVVVSNAAYGLFGAAEELTDEQINRQLATNLVGSIQLIRAVIPLLREQGGGRIVQISSEGGQIAYPNFSLYHASKWGIEGFIESVAQEVASFGIDFLIAEPGPTKTNFASALDHGTALPCYEHTVSGELRRALASGEFEITGDADKTVEAIIACVDSAQPPFRLPLGRSAFNNIRLALQQRLALLQSLEEIARSADSQ